LFLARWKVKQADNRVELDSWSMDQMLSWRKWKCWSWEWAASAAKY